MITPANKELLVRLIEKYASDISTEEIITFVADNDGMLVACKLVIRRNNENDLESMGWLTEQCSNRQVRVNDFLSEIKLILSIFQFGQEGNKHYDALGLARGASKKEIKEAYKKLSLKYHPDTATGVNLNYTTEFIKITEAYNALMKSNPPEQVCVVPVKRPCGWRRKLGDGVRREYDKLPIVLTAFLGLAVFLLIVFMIADYRQKAMIIGLQRGGSEVQQRPGQDETAASLLSPNTEGASLQRGADAVAFETDRDVVVSSFASDFRSSESIPVENDGLPFTDKHEVSLTDGEVYKGAIKNIEKDTEKQGDYVAGRSISVMNGDVGRQSEENIAVGSKQVSEKGLLLSPDSIGKGTDLHKTDTGISVVEKDTVALSSSNAYTASQSLGISGAELSTIAVESLLPVEYNEHQEDTVKVVGKSANKKVQAGQIKEAVSKKNIDEATQNSLSQQSKPENILGLRDDNLPVTREEIEDFFIVYSNAYNSRNILSFSRFFALDATENGQPLVRVMPTYVHLFENTDYLSMKIKVFTWKQSGDNLSVDGRFSIAVKMKDADTVIRTGNISFLLSHKDELLVKRMQYTFD